MLKGIEQNGRAEEEKEKTSGGEKEKEKSHESEICSFHLFTYAIVVSRNPDARPPPPRVRHFLGFGEFSKTDDFSCNMHHLLKF